MAGPKGRGAHPGRRKKREGKIDGPDVFFRSPGHATKFESKWREENENAFFLFCSACSFILLLYGVRTENEYFISFFIIFFFAYYLSISSSAFILRCTRKKTFFFTLLYFTLLYCTLLYFSFFFTSDPRRVKKKLIKTSQSRTGSSAGTLVSFFLFLSFRSLGTCSPRLCRFSTLLVLVLQQLPKEAVQILYVGEGVGGEEGGQPVLVGLSVAHRPADERVRLSSSSFSKPRRGSPSWLPSLFPQSFPPCARGARSTNPRPQGRGRGRSWGRGAKGLWREGQSWGGGSGGRRRDGVLEVSRTAAALVVVVAVVFFFFFFASRDQRGGEGGVWPRGRREILVGAAGDGERLTGDDDSMPRRGPAPGRAAYHHVPGRGKGGKSRSSSPSRGSGRRRPLSNLPARPAKRMARSTDLTHGAGERLGGREPRAL